MERLGEDDAVVGVGRQRASFLKVRDESRSRVRGIDVDDDALGNPIVPELHRVRVVLNLEHGSMDRIATCVQKRFDVPPVHGCASTEAVVVIERLSR
jgi:hypothetical protein